MEYFYEGQLRWSYGFSNPNHAAALLASVIPLLLAGIRLVAIVPRSKWTIALEVAAASVFISAWYLLFKTYSRGGAAAAAAGCVYVAWRYRRELFARLRTSRRVLLFGVATGMILAGLAWKTGVAERSAMWLRTSDASVENRETLWLGALRMISDAPRGVGTGKSGDFYMQWYQGFEERARYRTLVNSYLTWTAERGWLPALALGIAVAALWRATRRREWRVVCARGALVAFAVAGFFSTTMETLAAWLAAFSAMSILLADLCAMFRSGEKALRMRTGRLLDLPKIEGMCATILPPAGVLGAIIVAGTLLERTQPVRIHSGNNGIVEVSPADGGKRDLFVMSDDAVLGDDCGKLVRQLASEADIRLRVTQSGPVSWDDDILVAGDAAAEMPRPGKGVKILLAPSEIEETTGVLSENSLLFLPEMDEDGRVDFWEEAARGTPARVVTLDGVGNMVGWKWKDVVDEIVRFLAAHENPG